MTDSSEASSSRSSADRPTVGRPWSTAIVAGTAPPSRTMPSTVRAISTFCGYGMPWLMMVLSSATTGRPDASASRTSSVTVSIQDPFSDGCCSVSWAMASARSGRTVWGLSTVAAAAR